MHIHIGCICLTFLHCVSPICLPEWMHNHIGCISPPCVFKYALKLLALEDSYSHWLHLFDFSLSNRLLVRMQSNILLHCAFSNVSSNHLPVRMQNHIGCICLIFLHYAFSNVSSNCLPEKRHYHTDYIGCLFSIVCHFKGLA